MNPMNRKQAAITSSCLKIFFLIVVVSAAGTKLMAAAKTEIAIAHKNLDDGKRPARKERTFKNQNAVRIFPDAIKKTVHVVARSGNKKEIDFLVFDINGNMVLNYKMKAGEKKTISDLKKGAYMYHVFAEDEYLMTGKIVFK
jgi:hypothetical protein